MNTAVALFDYRGTKVRTVTINGQGWAVAADVTNLLGYGGGARNAVTKLPDRMKGVAEINTPGGTQRMTVINEAGFNRLILRSNLPNAEEIQDWLAETVMPAIQRTGQYAPVEISRLELIDMAREAELARIAEAEARQVAESKVLELEGPAAQAEVFRSSEGMCTIGDLANRFQDWALEHHPDAKVLHKHVFDHAARLGLIIRGNTVRHNQGTSQAIKAGWIKHNRVQYDTHTRGMQTKVSVRLTSRGEARLWDGLVAYLRDHSTLEIRKSA